MNSVEARLTVATLLYLHHVLDMVFAGIHHALYAQSAMSSLWI